VREVRCVEAEPVLLLAGARCGWRGEGELGGGNGAASFRCALEQERRGRECNWRHEEERGLEVDVLSWLSDRGAHGMTLVRRHRRAAATRRARSDASGRAGAGARVRGGERGRAGPGRRWLAGRKGGRGPTR
jgi:hypothetical protein